MSEDSDDRGDPLTRIADALERLAPQPEPVVDLKSSPAFVFAPDRLRAVERLDAPSLELLRGIDEQKERVVTNVLRLAQGRIRTVTTRRSRPA